MNLNLGEKIISKQWQRIQNTIRILPREVAVGNNKHAIVYTGRAYEFCSRSHLHWHLAFLAQTTWG